MATLLKVLNNLADIKSAGGVALRVRTQGTVEDLVMQRSITSDRLTNSHLFASGPEAPELIDFIMSPACPVSASLSNVDRGELMGIKQWWIEHAAK